MSEGRDAGRKRRGKSKRSNRKRSGRRKYSMMRAYRDYHAMVVRLARRCAPRHLVDDFIGEGMLKLCCVYDRYMRSPTPISEEEFGAVLYRSLMNRFVDMIRNYQRVSSLEVYPGDVVDLEGDSVPWEETVEGRPPERDHDSAESRMNVRDVLYKIAMAISREIPEEAAMEVFRHMLMSREIRNEMRKTFLRKMHLRRLGYRVSITRNEVSAPGSPVPVRLILKVMGLEGDRGARDMVCSIIDRIRLIAIREMAST